MSILSDQKLFEQDDNIRKMWLEQQTAFEEQQVNSPKLGFDNIWVREFRHMHKKSYQVVGRAGYQNQEYNLNMKSRRPNFHAWYKETQADLQLNTHIQNYKFTYWMDETWNLGVIHIGGELLAGRLYYRDQYYSERIASEGKTLGGDKGGYIEISFNKWRQA